MESLRALRQLVVLADVGHYRKASAKLGITHSALSQAVKRLQDSYGVPIFARHGGRIVPTAYGELLIDTARRSLERFQETEREIGLIKSVENGRIAIGVDSYFTESLLAPALARLIARYPRLRFTLKLQTRQAVPQSLREKSIEIYIGPPPGTAERGIVSDILRAPAPVAICRADHPLTRVKQPAFRDLLAYPIACGAPPDSLLERARELFPDFTGPAKMLTDRFIVTDDFSLLPGIVTQSDAVALLPRAVAAPDLDYGSIIALDIADQIPAYADTVAIAKLENRALPKAAMILKSEILKELGQTTDDTGLAALG